MLSRIAESLFWIGRYVERADGTARILDVHLERLNHLPPEQQQQVARDLLQVMGSPLDRQDITLPELLRVLAYDRSSPTSIAGALGAARENARRARETVSTSLWECLNTTYFGLSRHRAAPPSPCRSATATPRSAPTTGRSFDQLPKSD